MQAVLVVKHTRFETAGERALALMKAGDPVVAGWQRVHEAHMRTLEVVHSEMLKRKISCTVVRDPYMAFDVRGADIVIVVGGDGTFLAASHSVGQGLPMLGVNSDPETSRGFFCPATSENFGAVLDESSDTVVNRMMVTVNGETRSRRVLNEALLCHPHPAATSRFFYHFGDTDDIDGWEKHVSSGAWIGPPAGTTGAIRSAGGDVVLPLSSEVLEFVSRETIVGPTRKLITPYPVRARVKSDEAAIYMDGPYKHAALSMGDLVELRISDELLTIVGLDARC